MTWQVDIGNEGWQIIAPDGKCWGLNKNYSHPEELPQAIADHNKSLSPSTEHELTEQHIHQLVWLIPDTLWWCNLCGAIKSENSGIVSPMLHESELTALRSQVESLTTERTEHIRELNQRAEDARNDRQKLYERIWAAEQRLATENRLLRASVPERWKDCDSPVGSVQSYIAELEGQLATARQALEKIADARYGAPPEEWPYDGWGAGDVAGVALEALTAESGENQ